MTRWSNEQANEWYKSRPWPIGANFAPQYASNQIEMWQAETFDAKRIDLELGWAKDLGMNTMRVFLHDLVWQQDPAGFKERLDTFLDLAAKHGIKPMLVLFDSVWDPNPATGAQREPQAGVHNAGWVQGPGAKALADKNEHPRLEAYVKDIVGTFAQDERVLLWDVWNEPDNTNAASYGAQEPADKIALVAPLLEKTFEWARSVKPAQPLTSGVWIGHWDGREHMNAVQQVQLAQSDIISFHNYEPAAQCEERINYLKSHGRPLLCTEYMARPLGSTFEDILPLLKKHDVGAFNWGFVQGRTQTHLPWDSWQKPYATEPPVWFHEILRGDGTPYRPEETALIRKMSGKDIAPAAQPPRRAAGP